MKNAKLSLVIVIALITGSTAMAASTCFKSVAEYEAVKGRLPAILQELPVAFKRSAAGVYPAAVLQIRANGEKLYLEGYKVGMTTRGKLVRDGATIKQVCVNGSQVTLALANGESTKVKIENNSNISVSGAWLTKTDSADYASSVRDFKIRAGSIPEPQPMALAGGGGR